MVNNSVLRNQFLRHIGYDERSAIFNNSLGFLTHNPLSRQSANQLPFFSHRHNRVVDSNGGSNNNHFLIFNRLASEGNSNNNVVLISFNTFTHTRQRFLDRNNIGLDSLPNLRLNTISNNDFNRHDQPQQMLTNTVIVPESFLNLDQVESIGSSSSENTNAIISRVVTGRANFPAFNGLTELPPLSMFGRPYLLLERPEQYYLIMERIQSARAMFPNNFNLDTAIGLLQDDLRAFEQNQLTPFLESQINALVLINRSISMMDQQELIFDAFRRAYIEYSGISGDSVR